MLANQFSVFHFSATDEDKSPEFRQTIREHLAAGMDVLVVCPSGVRRRVARMSLALTKQHDEFPGARFAVVTPNPEEFIDSLPRSVIRDLTIFNTRTEAIDWLNEQFDAMENDATLEWSESELIFAAQSA